MLEIGDEQIRNTSAIEACHVDGTPQVVVETTPLWMGAPVHSIVSLFPPFLANLHHHREKILNIVSQLFNTIINVQTL